MAHELIEFDEESHIYRVNGKEYPSVTQILKSVGLTQDYSMVNPEVLEWKRIFGTELHKAIELDIYDDLDSYDPILKPYLDGWWQLRDVLKLEPIAAELPVYSGKFGYCGKLDLFSKYQGNKLGLFDYKSSVQIELISVGAQQSGYEIGYREWDDIKDSIKIDRFAIKFNKKGECKLVPLADPMDKNTFLYSVSLHNRKALRKYVA
jgi:hypothetical protein